MSKKVDDAEVFGPPEKVIKALKKYNDSLLDTLADLDEDGLRKKIVLSEKNILDSTRALDADQEIKVMKDQVKEATGAYKDTIKGEGAVAQYCVYLMESKGIQI